MSHVGALAHLCIQVAGNEIAVLILDLGVNDNLGNAALVANEVRFELANVSTIERSWVRSCIILSNAGAAELA